jgi:hypothetical protein
MISKRTQAGMCRFFSSIHFIGFCSHNEIILMQTANLMSPPIDVQIARIPKILVWRRTVKILVARIPKNLVHRPSVNLMVDGNH